MLYLLLLMTVYQQNILLLHVAVSSHHLNQWMLVSQLHMSITRHRKAGSKIRRQRRYWVRPGRTCAWWDSFVNGTVVAEEWKENFRMSKSTFLKLCDELRPHITRHDTVMR